jgi:alpha-ribazole phosphatase
MEWGIGSRGSYRKTTRIDLAMRLLLVRHGATFENEQKRYIGQTDVALSPRGESQAAQLGANLANQTIDLIVTSDLQRARATAEAIARHHTVPLEPDSDLREINRGIWEGATYAEVQEHHAELLARWRHTPAECQIPGGETLFQLRDRVARALERWYIAAPAATVVWVTHAGVIQVALCHLLDVNLNSWRQFRRDNASITPVRVERVDGKLVGSIETAPEPRAGSVQKLV